MEAHSIAFSAQYFWIIPTVFLGSIVGVSQTEAAIPRILRRFQLDLDRLPLVNSIKLPNDCLHDNQRRIFHGGIYSWQPQKYHPSRTTLTDHKVPSYLIVVLGTATGMIISAFVPPDGWGCRNIGEILILIAWLMSALIDELFHQLWPLLNEDNQRLNEDSQRLNKINQRKLLWTTGIKDLFATITTMGGIITTQLGVFNRCSCYTQWGRTGLALPEMPDVAEVLFHRLNTTYPIIAFIGIGIQLVIVPLIVCILYIDALRTFVQRDDKKSNAKWLWKSLKRYRASKAKIQAQLSRNTKRTRTFTLEMQPLAQGFSDSINTGSASAADAPITKGQSEPTPAVDPISRSSGVDPPSRTGTNLSSDSESRRRNTEREAELAEDQPLFPKDSSA